MCQLGLVVAAKNSGATLYMSGAFADFLIETKNAQAVKVRLNRKIECDDPVVRPTDGACGDTRQSSLPARHGRARLPGQVAAAA